MRRALGALLISFILLPVAAPEVAAGNYRLRLDRRASARWLLPTSESGHYRILAIEIWGATYAPSSAERLILAVLRGRCEVEDLDGGGWRMGCFGRGAIKRIPSASFSMDPLLRFAHLDARLGGRRYRATWDAAEDDILPGIFHYSERCISKEEEGRGQGGGMFRETSAQGRVSGRRYETDIRYEDAVLSSGVVVTECDVPWTASQIRRAARGETVTAEW
jgi:hypothetical protein